ncbi:hypothetical protein BMETH_1418_0 [methanotrophic bacterial endosymbiont of Bathymodiolus sp.]|nr:hypothetical protein BMETH_1418_0 [methanotrophic bacterial endosymbiont of Bathymodiolus sp.]
MRCNPAQAFFALILYNCAFLIIIWFQRTVQYFPINK